jgi:hypothetical protein
MNEIIDFKNWKHVIIFIPFSLIIMFFLFVLIDLVLRQTKIIPEPIVSECKNIGFHGYVISSNGSSCSNGEIKDGCIITKNGKICGNFNYIEILNK